MTAKRETNSSHSVVVFDASDASSRPKIPGNKFKNYRYVKNTEIFLPVEHICAFCGKNSFNLKSCTRCWWAKYCDSFCQRNHWPQHRADCREDPSQKLFFKGGRIVEFDLFSGTDVLEAGPFGRRIFLGLDKCPKNGHNNHADFIGVEEFTTQHLPQSIQYDVVTDYLKAESQMTVRVLVNWTSKNRPEGDACANYRNTKKARTASGTYILDDANDFVSKQCLIPNCQYAKELGEVHTYFEGDLKIFTNKHVLFDDEELRNTVVDFFYNSDDRQGVVREYGVQLFYTKPTTDRTFFKLTVHKREFLEHLLDLEVKRSSTFQKIPPAILQKMSAYAIVISHPHGLPKKISIGRVIRVTEENLSDETVANAKTVGRLEKEWFASRSKEDYWRYMQALGSLNMPMYKVWYNTPTCQGSSGVPVLFGARHNNGVWGPYTAYHTAFECDSNLNYFKVGRFMD